MREIKAWLPTQLVLHQCWIDHVPAIVAKAVAHQADQACTRSALRTQLIYQNANCLNYLAIISSLSSANAVAGAESAARRCQQQSLYVIIHIELIVQVPDIAIERNWFTRCRLNNY